MRDRAGVSALHAPGKAPARVGSRRRGREAPPGCTQRAERSAMAAAEGLRRRTGGALKRRANVGDDMEGAQRPPIPSAPPRTPWAAPRTPRAVGPTPSSGRAPPTLGPHRRPRRRPHGRRRRHSAPPTPWAALCRRHKRRRCVGDDTQVAKRPPPSPPPDGPAPGAGPQAARLGPRVAKWEPRQPWSHRSGQSQIRPAAMQQGRWRCHRRWCRQRRVGGRRPARADADAGRRRPAVDRVWLRPNRRPTQPKVCFDLL